MKKKYNIPEDIELKKMFNSIKNEKPSDDFTLSVMERITKEKIAPVKYGFIIPRLFYFLLVPFITLITAIIILIKKFSYITIDFQIPSFSFVTNWTTVLLENSQKIFSPAIISISLASFLLYTFFVISNNRNLTEKK